MGGVRLFPHQTAALRKMHNGCILAGAVGSGKSITGLAYYYISMGGEINGTEFKKMIKPKDLYIITTAKKRDSKEWELEMAPFLLSPNKDACAYDINVVIDSWNCIKKYKDVSGAFFLFDEDKVTGTGTWAKSFINIARNNQWIILSATPGDCFMDYAAVFVANGYFKTITEFKRKHVVFSPFVRFPQIERYDDIPKLNRLRRNVLVEMPFKRDREIHNEHIFCDFDRERYKSICRDRWNPFTDEPIENASQFCYALRRASNDSQSRQLAVLEIFEKQPKLIIFYNFNYELETLRALCDGLGVIYAEWNSFKHEELPAKEEKFVYLVNYIAAAEAWNTVATDTIIFYSQTYSYKTLIQAQGRIDRLNSPFRDLYYYHLLSRSGIDLSIKAALDKKKKFNESRFCGDIFKDKV